MTIGDGALLKLAQRIDLPDAVTAMNIFYLKANFTEDQEDGDVVVACRNYMITTYGEVDNQMSDEVSLGDLTVYRYNHITDQWDNVGSESVTVPGLNVTDMLPHGVSALVRAYSFNPRSIARKYLPGFSEDQQEHGVWLAGALTAMAAFGVEWSTIKPVSTGNELEPGVFDNVLKEIHRLTGVEVALATPAYQRRRRPGVGI